MRSKTMGMVLLCHLILVAFVGDDPDWHVFKLSVMLVLKLCCFRYIWTWFVITLCELRCMLNYLWTCCNMWLVCWIMYDLGCMLVDSRSFVILDGLPGLYKLKCACQCVNRPIMHDLVLLHLSPRSTIRCVQNNFWASSTFGANSAPILQWH
jgi:hypothetical protein